MSKILLTGATGYIGNKLLKALLQTGTETLLIPIRAASSEEFSKRSGAILAQVERHAGRVEFIHSELNELPEKLNEDQNKISKIIHNAAKTAFNVDETTANLVNRDASLKLLEFAEGCESLKSFIYVSTLYSSGMTSGEIKENFFEKPKFANHYERSKWEVEESIRTRFNDLPWKIARVATVIADSHSGSVVQQNAIHNTLKLFYYGLISLLPGKADTPIHLVDGEFVTESLLAIINEGKNHGIYNVCYDQEASLTLGRLIDVAYEEFSRDDGFKSRRLLKPLFTDESSFDTLVANVKGFGGSVLNQGLASISPFGRQLFVNKKVRNEEMLSLLPTYQRPATEQIIRKTCQFLVETKFAKNSGGLQ